MNVIPEMLSARGVWALRWDLPDIDKRRLRSPTILSGESQRQLDDLWLAYARAGLGESPSS